MRRSVFLLVAGCVFAGTLLIRDLGAADPPRLLVTIVVDQMRADYLQQFARHWQKGFRTLLDQGLVFDNARYPYLVTVTCAGHATIGTGTFPHRHGMVNNTWWMRQDRMLTGCSTDAATSAVSYTHLTLPTIYSV